jgi:hypothetical protein
VSPIKPMTVTSLPAFLEAVDRDHAAWRTKAAPWFRGEPENVETPLLPRLYRGPHERHQDYDENNLLQWFRRYAPVRLERAPPREATDDWLFLAQHHRLPTRLLDWSEGALIALYFALEESRPLVWMLNPLALLKLTAPDAVPNAFAITWWSPPGPVANVGVVNIRAAWADFSGPPTELPIPIHPTVTHPRMSAQRSCFTIFGTRRESLSAMVDEACLRAYRIDMNHDDARRQLRVAGISRAGLFPDVENLAVDLEGLYRVPRVPA